MEEPATEGAAERLVNAVLRHRAVVIGQRHGFRPGQKFLASGWRAVRIQASRFDQIDIVIQVHRMQIARQAVELAVDFT